MSKENPVIKPITFEEEKGKTSTELFAMARNAFQDFPDFLEDIDRYEKEYQICPEEEKCRLAVDMIATLSSI